MSGAATDRDHVSFRNAPVSEVALGVQFAPETIDVELLGLFSHDLRADFPERQRHPALPPIVETFDVRPSADGIEIRLEEGLAALPRIWMMSEDNILLVQLQHDRLTLNWRKLNDGDEYPRYRVLRARFEALLATLEQRLAEVGKTMSANVCEVIYVNPVPDPDGSQDRHPDLGRIINRWLQPAPEAFLQVPEDAQLQARWRIPRRGDDRPQGRLYFGASPGFRSPSGEPIYIVNWTSRVLPGDSSSAAAMTALDLGREWVVRGFKDLSTNEMRALWGEEETE